MKSGKLAGILWFLLVPGAVVCLTTAAPRRQSSGPQDTSKVIEVHEARHDVSPALRDIKPIMATERSQSKDEADENEGEQKGTSTAQPPSFTADPVLQNFAGRSLATNSGLSFDGVATSGWLAPDTNGAAGATQFVEWVNARYAVYDKTTGALKLGPLAGNTLWKNFGGPCQTNNNGDVIAQYDKAAGRWVMTQHTTSPAGGPYYQCVAISTTSDATGSYYRYAFPLPAYFPDYPKLAVWPDAYYLSINLAQPSGSAFVSPYVCALDRSSMLTGSAATAQCFQVSSRYESLLPSDWDGATPPPSGSPNYFVNFGTNSLNIWQFHVDWSNTSNTTFTGPTNIPVAAFSEACTNGGACIPQLGTSQQLDSLGDRLMYRLAYRNFGDHEAMVVNHSVVAGSSVGVRWYEIRSPGSNPFIYQSGTYAPDSNYRWMGSIAMDKAGDMAVGYSVSSSSMNPAIRYTGRVPTDALGTLEGENTIIQGTGSQQSSDHRWGDYTSMAIDPVDDCTFWYANEYVKTNGTINWRTHIASFSFPSCSQTASFSLSASPSSQTVVQGSSTTYTVTVTPSNGFNGTVNFSTSGLPTGASASFSPSTVTGSGSTTMTVTTASTTTTGSSTVTITGTSGSLSPTTSVTLVVNAPPNFSLSASPSSQTVAPGSSTTYTVTVTPSNGFIGTVNFSASGLPTDASASFNPASVTGSGSTTVTVATASTTPTGGFTLTVTGTSGSLSQTTSVTLVVSASPSFSLSASPSSQTVVQGSSTTYTVTVTPSNGFNGTVNFSTSGLPTGASASFSPSTVTGSGSTTMTVSTASTTTTGSSTVTITGTSGSLSPTTSVTLVVNAPPSFSLSASPSSQTVVQGSSTTYTITVTPSNGFNGSVSFSTTGLPTGASASFSPSTVTGSGSTTMTVTTASTTTTGSSTVTITGTSGSLSPTTSVTLVVNAPPSFSLSASPSSQTVVQGSSTTYTVTVTPSNGFNGSVSFSTTGLPTGASASFSPSTVTGSGSTTMTVTTASTTTTGSSTVTITGTSGSLNPSVSVMLIVNAGGGSGIALVQSNAAQGSGVGSVSVAFPVNNTAGNLIIAFVRMSTTSQTVQMADSAGNAYTDAVSQVQSVDGHQVHLFYAKNVLGGANTVTATFSSTNNHPWLAVYEYSGLNTTNPLDQTASAQGTGTAPNSGATAPTVSASELVFAATGLPASFAGTVTAGGGYILLQQDTGTSPGANEAMVVASTGSYSGAFSVNPGDDWTAVVATFKP